MASPKVNDPCEIEHTKTRIYAYLHARQVLSGNHISEEYQRGRELIAILAETSEGYDKPKRKLALDECADVIAYMHGSEPRNRDTYSREPDSNPSIECGHNIVLWAVEEAIRNAVAPRKAKKAA